MSNMTDVTCEAKSAYLPGAFDIVSTLYEFECPFYIFRLLFLRKKEISILLKFQTFKITAIRK